MTKKELYCFSNESDTQEDNGLFVKEIAKVGIFNDSKGRPFKFTTDFFDSLIKKTKEMKHEPFIPVGHPKEDDPRTNTGFLVDFWRDGESLFGKFKIDDDETKEGIKKGTIKHNSIGIMKDLLTDAKYYLQHVALTFQPMIGGLGHFKPVEFGEAVDLKSVEIVQFSRVEENEEVVKETNKEEEQCQKKTKRKINLRISM